MRIGIVGSGLMGGKLGTVFARAGHDVVFSYARSPEKLEQLARDAGATARSGGPVDAVRGADAVLLAVHWSRVSDALRACGDLAGTVIVSCSLPMNADDTELAVRLYGSIASPLSAQGSTWEMYRRLSCHPKVITETAMASEAPAINPAAARRSRFRRK